MVWSRRLQPTEKQEQFLRDDHPIQKAITSLNEQFGVSSEDRGIDVFYTWGLKEVDRAGANILLNITYTGKWWFLVLIVLLEIVLVSVVLGWISCSISPTQASDGY